MTAENISISIKDRIAMFQKLNSGSVPTIPKKQVISNTAKPTPVVTVQKDNINKRIGQVESPPIVKPNMIKQSQQANSLNFSNNSPNKLASSLANNPWVQQNMATKNQQKKPSQGWGKQQKAQGLTKAILKQTFPQKKEGQSGNTEAQKIVKITQNALVDKQSLPSQNAMKLIIEERLIGLKKPQQAPKKFVEVKNEDSGSKQVPIVQTELKIGSVKENANKLNNFFQVRVTQKRESQKEQIKHNQPVQVLQVQKQKESQPGKQQNEKGLSLHQADKQNNSQNINVGLLSNQPQQGQKAPQIPENNTLNTVTFSGSSEKPEESGPSESQETTEETQNLANRLKKRKKMTKQSFDSDDD